jgi:membrane-associated phospholipid phosphatase
MLEHAKKIDNQTLEWMRSWINPDNTLEVTAIRYIADIELLAVIVLLVGLWLRGVYSKNDDYKRKALVLFYLIALGYVLYWFVSLFIIQRIRPELATAIVPLIDHIPDNSFPSGHAIFAGTALVGIYLIGSRFLLVLFSFLFAGMLLARIFAGIHYPGDILAGLILGVAFACMISFLRKKPWFETYAIQFPLKFLP